MPPEISLSEFAGLVGTEVGVSKWFDVPQSRIDLFADATDDHQFIHVDAQRAEETQFGGTIAHGFLTMSLLSAMNFDCVPSARERTLGINYGFDKVRFMSPVPSGSRIRGRFKLADARFRGENMLVLSYDVTVEIEGAAKPAMVATWLSITQFDPKDRPTDA